MAGSLRCLALQLRIWKWCSVPGCASGCCLGSYITCFRFAPLVYLTNKCWCVLYYCCAYRCYMLIIFRFRWIINTFVCLSAIDILCRWDCSLVFASVHIIFKAAQRSHSSITQSQKSQHCIMKSLTHCVSFASQPEQKKIIHIFYRLSYFSFHQAWWIVSRLYPSGPEHCCNNNFVMLTMGYYYIYCTV